MPAAPGQYQVVYAVHDFKAEDEDEVSFKTGEEIVVLERDDEFGDGWWMGRTQDGQIGLFPANFTSPTPRPPKTWDGGAKFGGQIQMFNVAGVFVSMTVRCPEARLSQLAEREAYRVSRLPATTMQHIRDRQRRRALW
ncbi:hypothetical protein AMAG_20445 [Allomyces macrogynus ATCC 38327]|uniref:SH3 domain-containing protein n=1 Tax=Allomyces macrogynus (strain ATCC 38327) TaxID=578462 RepID=A0A0L0TAK4_ALLM3|nr:hypothetical protein AMAG_20445 [Allomyces macrogynus ATCC 38327]|eukprot:KNE71792.1 hypothetical protein AMAG_20445 [Allomyces macrogynus ATCC 38327]